ncbi:MAG TPA: hypothetical protein VI933_01650 [archaeon]|nr:hypothetical protein [archaeon]
MRKLKSTSLSYKWVKENVSLLVRETLTERQNLVFMEACEASEKLSASAFVRLLVGKHKFSETSVWHILSKLKRMGLVDFGKNLERKTLVLTEFGKMFLGGERYVKT